MNVLVLPITLLRKYERILKGIVFLFVTTGRVGWQFEQAIGCLAGSVAHGNQLKLAIRLVRNRPRQRLQNGKAAPIILLEMDKLMQRPECGLIDPLRRAQNHTPRRIHRQLL